MLSCLTIKSPFDSRTYARWSPPEKTISSMAERSCAQGTLSAEEKKGDILMFPFIRTATPSRLWNITRWEKNISKFLYTCTVHRCVIKLILTGRTFISQRSSPASQFRGSGTLPRSRNEMTFLLDVRSTSVSTGSRIVVLFTRDHPRCIGDAFSLVALRGLPATAASWHQRRPARKKASKFAFSSRW